MSSTLVTSLAVFLSWILELVSDKEVVSHLKNRGIRLNSRQMQQLEESGRRKNPEHQTLR